MNVHSLFAEFRKLSVYDYVSHKVIGVDTVIVLRNVNTESEETLTLCNAEARLFLSVFGVVKDFVENGGEKDES